jgi:sec-independent protein translocase protein TatA
MGGLSIWHILILAIVAILLFGRGKISDMMGDVAKGIRNFREGLKDPNEAQPPKTIPSDSGTPSSISNKDTATHS